MFALVASLALLATPPPVPAFEVIGEDGVEPIGSAFVALAWDDLPGAPRDTPLLFTAAHVLAPPGASGRRQLRIAQVLCAGERSEGSYQGGVLGAKAPVLVWPGMDLAAIPFPPAGQILPTPSDKQLDDLRARAARLSSPPGTGWSAIDIYAQLLVIGFHAASPCGTNPALYFARPTWGDEARTLLPRTRTSDEGDATAEERRRRFSGSMQDDTELVQYWSPVGPGASGGPVWFLDPALSGTTDGRIRVVGVHVGGTRTQGSGWAVVVPSGGLPVSPASTLLGSPPSAWPKCVSAPESDPSRWPCYRAPTFRHSLDRAPTGIRGMARRSAAGVFTIGLSLGSDVGTSFGNWRSASSQFGGLSRPGNLTLRGAIGADYLLRRGQALGARFVGGWRASEYAQTLHSPAGVTLETVMQKEDAFVGELWPVEYSFRRSSRFWPTVGIGVRATVRRMSNIAWALPVHARIAYPSLFPALAFTADLMASLELDPDLSRHYTLSGALERDRRSEPGLSFGIAIGVDVVAFGGADAP